MGKLKTGKYLWKNNHFLGAIRKKEKSLSQNLKRTEDHFTVIQAAKCSSHIVSPKIKRKEKRDS